MQLSGADGASAFATSHNLSRTLPLLTESLNPRRETTRRTLAFTLPKERVMSARRKYPSVAEARVTTSHSQPSVQPNETSPARLLRFPEVRHRTGLSRTTIWRLEQKRAFPQHRTISTNAVGWLEEDVDGWIRTRSPLTTV